MKLYAFDVDETLAIAGGPVQVDDLVILHGDGDIVGICGNFAVMVQKVPNWWYFISFLGSMGMTKPEFLTQLSTYVPADEYIMVGNIFGVSGSSHDSEAAQEAGWRFIKESNFASGER